MRVSHEMGRELSVRPALRELIQSAQWKECFEALEPLKAVFQRCTKQGFPILAEGDIGDVIFVTLVPGIVSLRSQARQWKMPQA